MDEPANSFGLNDLQYSNNNGHNTFIASISVTLSVWIDFPINQQISFPSWSLIYQMNFI
jgi:hypothetical protein